MEENKSWRQLLQLQLLLIRSREENAELVAQIEKLQIAAQDLRAKQLSATSIADQDDGIILISTQLYAEEVEVGKLKLAKDQAEARKRWKNPAQTGSAIIVGFRRLLSAAAVVIRWLLAS